MLTLEEIISMERRRRVKPTHEDLRKLPYLKFFIYGRLSDPHQVRDSKESVLEIARLVDIARSDGYKTGLTSEQAERVLLSIQAGNTEVKVIEDGDGILDVQDLGVSAAGLSDEKRAGLAHLRKCLESGQIGAVYVTEGVSRLSRDEDFILPFQLLKLFKQHNCRLRTPDGIWNPAIERDWEELKDEFDEARRERGVRRRRLHRKKSQKAARGEYVGEPVPPGFILPIVGRKANGQYEFGKYQPYSPHGVVDTKILSEVIAQGGSVMRTIRALGDLAFPLFPEELAYMEPLSSLRMCPKTPQGYRITPDLIRGLVRNPKLVGIWRWGDTEPIPKNHDPTVDQDLWLEAYEVSIQPGKPKGRAAYYEPLEYSDILYCYNHSDPQLVSSHSSEESYRCQCEYFRGKGDICLDIVSRFIDKPLTTEVLRQLDFTPCAEDVLAKLEAEVAQGKLEETERDRRVAELERRLENLKSYLGCGDQQREEAYWEQYKKTSAELDDLKSKTLSQKKATPADIEEVRGFLAELPAQWATYSRTLRNRLLKLLLDRVELRHDGRRIEARIVWRAGLEQVVTIQLPPARGSRDKRWVEQEDNLLKMLWPSSPKDVVRAGLPGRGWRSIRCHAQRLGLKRERGHTQRSPQRRWKPEEEVEARVLYEAGGPIPELAGRFNRQPTAILNKAAKQGWRRPYSAKWPVIEVTWSADELKVLESVTSRR